MSNFAADTKRDVTICPYCGGTHTKFSHIDGIEEIRKCLECYSTYEVFYDENSFDDDEYTVVEDVTDRHRFSLLR